MRVKPPSGPKGRWARFLVGQREVAGLTQKATFEAFRQDLGWATDSRASYGDLERGDRQPNPEEQAYFLKHYGFDELPDDEASAEEPTLARALIELTAELRASRLEREAVEIRLQALEAELRSLRAPRGDEGRQGRSAPLGSAR